MEDLDPPDPIDSKVLLSPDNFNPSSSDMKIVGAFNPGVTTVVEGGLEKSLLMVRIAEMHEDENMAHTTLPYFEVENKQDSPFKVGFDEVNSNVFGVKHRGTDVVLKNGLIRMKHISYPVVVILDENGKVELDECGNAKFNRDGLYPCYEHEKFGIEDVRITKMNEGRDVFYNGENYKFLLTYIVPHRTHGVSTCLAFTNDFNKFVRATPVPNDTPRPISRDKDEVFFPKRINKRNYYGDNVEKFAKLCRPSSFSNISPPNISISYGDYPTNWGMPRRLIESEHEDIVTFSGPGPAPLDINKEDGFPENIWLVFYHEVESERINGNEGHHNIYRTALLGLNYDDPSDVIYKTRPFIEPNSFGEKRRPFSKETSDVTYVLGAEFVDERKKIRVISGENDECVSIRHYKTEDILKYLEAGKL
jgi:predicted GH43/DUF377 family glycosyl hydrolase